MGSLIFSCPKTWRVIETGIETDEKTIALIRSRTLRVDCHHCRASHELKIKDGHLFTMRPRQVQIHSTALLCDEIDVGALVVRVLPDCRRMTQR